MRVTWYKARTIFEHEVKVAHPNRNGSTGPQQLIEIAQRVPNLIIGDQVGQRVADEPGRAHGRQLESVFPGVVADLLQAARRRPPGVDDQDVEACQRAGCGADQSLDVSALGEVGGLVAGGSDLAGQAGQRARIPGGDEDLGALPRERLRAGPSEALAGCGNQGPPAF